MWHFTAQRSETRGKLANIEAAGQFGPWEAAEELIAAILYENPQNQHMRGGVGGVVPLGTDGRGTGWEPVRKGKNGDAPI